MKKRILALGLGLCLLAGCAAPAAETPVPTVEATATPEPTPEVTPEPTPTPDRGNLTQEEIDRINEAFDYYAETEDGAVTTRPVNGFFLTHYADVKKMDLGAFLLYYFDGSGTLGPMSDAEREVMDSLPCFEGMDLEKLLYVLPLHRISRASVDETLNRYAGITTEDLTNRDGAFYMPGYEIYYTFTSDYDPGMFVCKGGRVEGDTAVLWTAERWNEGWREELTLKKEGERWYIRSFLRVAMNRERSLDAYLLGLTREEIEEVSTGWGFGNIHEAEWLAEQIRAAAQNRVESWEYGKDETVWNMAVSLKDGTHLGLGAGLAEGIVEMDRKGKVDYFRAPELYWALWTEYDSGRGGTVNIDQAAYETYQAAVEGYLTEQAWDPAVRVKLTGFSLKQESKTLGAQVWVIGTELTTDPPELAVRMVGNGYVDSQLRMYPISSDGPSNLLVVADGEALGFRDRLWLDNGGLEQYDTVEELENSFWPIEKWEKEVLSDKPGSPRTCFYVAAPDGTRRLRLDVNQTVEERDLDGDGEMELIGYHSTQNMTIYDIIGGELRSLDVNETLGTAYSDYTGNIGNIDHPYSRCISAGNTLGGSRNVYRYEANGTLTYLCPLDDALRK